MKRFRRLKVISDQFLLIIPVQQLIENLRIEAYITTNKRKLAKRSNKPDDKAAKVQGEHIKPIDSVDLEDSFLGDDDADNDKDQSVSKVSQCLPKPGIHKIYGSYRY